MAEKMEPRSPRLGRPPTITSEQIVDEAKRQLQSGGADALSMRALAKSLGTTPMALYRHVGDKEQLISAVLDVYSQDLGSLVLPQDQVERLRMIFSAIFEKLASERWIIELLQRGGRGGSGAVVLVDRAMAACVELGMSPRRALLVYRALWNYTLGALLNIYDTTPRPEGSVSPLAVKIREIGPEKLPILSEVLEDWPGGTTTESYMEGLEVLISGYVSNPE